MKNSIKTVIPKLTILKKGLPVCIILMSATLVNASPRFLTYSAQKHYVIIDTTGTAQIQQKAKSWVDALDLKDATKQSRVESLITEHLLAVRDWNNTHPFTTVPAGINPATGNKLSELDRRIIANSAKPASIHENLMNGLKKDLTEEQIETILDKYTIGKVAFTLKGYEAIVPDLTDTEKSIILTNLKQAREQAIDYKSIKEISAIFEIYKTKNEQYLNANGRNWHQLFKNYVNAVKAKKAAAKK